MWVFVGTLVGILFGCIPGLTATMAIAMFLPMTYGHGGPPRARPP